MAVSLEQFIGCLAESGLLSSEDLLAVRERITPDKHKDDAHGLARDLVRQGRLTLYQASLLYLGKSKGLVFGEYVVLDKIGQGGMGLVLKAQHRRMKRTVALKILAPSVTKSAHNLKRFQREVEAAARLSHPNIVTAFDAGEHRGMHYLVLEYVAGKDLSALVKVDGPFTPQQVVDFILQAARGLEHAHKAGVIHRDIKPGNLLLDIQGQVKILDMGLARFEGALHEPSAEENITRSGTVMGTADYMSPEQALNSRNADQRSDIYSLGCTLYYLLIGEPPYQGETAMERLLAHREQSIPNLRALRNGVPEQLDAVFRRMVAKRAADRQESMTELIKELEAIHSGDVEPVRRSVPVSNSIDDPDLLNFLGTFETQATATKTRVQSAPSDTLDDHSGAITSIAAVSESAIRESSTRSAIREPALKTSPLKMAYIGGAVAVLLLIGAGLFSLVTGKSDSPPINGPSSQMVIPPAVSAPISEQPLISTDEFHQVDHERTTATWVLTQGGKVTLQVDDRLPVDVTSIAHLPGERFQVLGVTFPESYEFNRANIARLSRLAKLSKLDLSGVKIPGGVLEQLPSLKSLTEVNLTGAEFPAASLDRLKTSLPECRVITAEN